MNLLKRSSPGPQGGSQSSMYSGRLTPSPHYTAGSTPGSPLTTHRTSGPAASSLLLQMGGENSAFKSLVPNSSGLFGAGDEMRLRGYLTDSDEEINVNDESDVEEPPARESRSSTPVEVVDAQQSCQPLELTTHDRE